MLYDTPYFTVEEVADGVYAAIAKPGAGSLANAGFVRLGDETLIWDTTLTMKAAQALRQVAEELTGCPVMYVLNSHSHSDHSGGNAVFNDLPIIATETTRSLMEANNVPMTEKARAHPDEMLAGWQAGLASAANEAQRLDMELNMQDIEGLLGEIETYEVLLPTLTFNEPIVFHGHERSAHFIPYGSNHTGSDSILYLPDDGIAFTADLVVIGYHMVLGEGDARHWLESLTKLEALGLKTVIPGHGAVGTGADVERANVYLKHLFERAATLVAEGQTAEELMLDDVPLPHEYKDYHWSYDYVGSLQFLMQQP